MFHRRTRATVGLLGLVLVTVGLVGLAQAVQPSPHRFVVLPPDQLGQVWVLDTTTSLRWQKTPSNNFFQWGAASTYCTDLQGGSRLPEVKELISLVDYSVSYPGPVLPAGHPFVDVQSADYWSATTFAGNPAVAWNVFFFNGNVSFSSKIVSLHAWCVR